ncbi:hypothetical protein MAR_005072 [Mya arenaria]|uniref:Ubiquitin-like protease family profile domain-containing protein n=1 Tax=Mya arenaria TaxID=6604 RepID=A0ABY7F1L1_MYAAR|nr:hypothetical protein MAR_005072 [Mya arenaria]
MVYLSLGNDGSISSASVNGETILIRLDNQPNTFEPHTNLTPPNTFKSTHDPSDDFINDNDIADMSNSDANVSERNEQDDSSENDTCLTDSINNNCPPDLNESHNEEMYTSSDKRTPQREENGTDGEESSNSYDTLTTQIPQSFTFELSKDEWETVCPEKDANKMKKGWTELFFDKFHHIVPTCAIAFKYHNVITDSKRNHHYFTSKAACKMPGCSEFVFVIKTRPKQNTNVKVNEHVRKPLIKHKKGEVAKRFPKGERRRKVASIVNDVGPSTFHYTEMGEMNEDEILFGNITRCQSKDVLRKAKSDFQMYDVLHDDPFTELILTKDILFDEDRKSKRIKGYIHEISYCPFMTTLYTEEQLDIAKQHVKTGDEMENSLSKLRHIVTEASSIDLDVEADSLTTALTNDETSLRRRSPFFGLFEVKVASGEGQHENEYFCAEAITLLHTQYMPLAPLWTGIMLEADMKSGIQLTRDTNNTVENWFRIVKCDSLQGKKKLRVGLFVRRIHVVLIGRLTGYLSGLDENIQKSKFQKQGSKRSKCRDNDGECQYDAKESWEKPNKRNKRKSFHYTPTKDFPTPKKQRTKSSQPESGTYPGVRNKSNSCWVISILQALSGITDISFQGEDCVLQLVENTIMGLKKRSDKGTILEIDELLGSLVGRFDDLVIGQQQDAAAFLNNILRIANQWGNEMFTSTIHSVLKCLNCEQSIDTGKNPIRVHADGRSDWTVSIRDGVPVLFDDHQVAVKSPSYINNRTVKECAYVLFYRRVNLKDAMSSVELVFNAERDARLHDTVVAELDNLHIVNFYMHVLKRNYVDIEVVDVFFVTAVTSKRNPEKYLPPGWIQRNRLNIPQQNNGHDCGVFMLQFARSEANQRLPDFSQGDVSRIRKIMVHEILSGSLFEEP